MTARTKRRIAFWFVYTALWWDSLKYIELMGPMLIVTVLLLLWKLSQKSRKVKHANWYRHLWPQQMSANGLRWSVSQMVKPPFVRRHGLIMPSRKPLPAPLLKKVSTGPWSDTLTVRMLPGQTVQDWEVRAEALAHGWSARDVRVHYVDPGHVALEVFHGDSLQEVVRAFAVGQSDIDLYAVPIGVREDGYAWTLQLQEWHWLIAGVTGAGKSSVIWSLIRALCPAIHAGIVEVWAIDPKGGMELRPGRDLFAHFVDDSYERMVNMLEGAVSEMRKRADRLAGKTRKHQATREEPLMVVIIDELANLTAYQPDVKLRKRVNDAVSLLLTQGRAVGVCVICALQDPRKDVVWFRNLFPGKIGLRLDEPEQVEMVLGEGARRRGARCDQIPESLPGVGFVKVDGLREPIRVRASWVTDQDIDDMVRTFKIDRAVVA